jgi:hypothetical protein
MKKIIMLIAIPLVIATFQSCAQSSATTLNSNILKELDNAEKSMFEASAKGDSAAFRKICGTDYYTINGDGTAHNLEETIPYVPRFKGSNGVLSEQTQRIYGNVALRTGRAKFYMGSQQVAEILYTTGWVYRDSRWQFIHWQGTMTGMMLEPFKGKMPLGPPPTKEEMQKQKQ